AASAPLVGTHRQLVVVLVGEAEHLLATVTVLLFDDPPHLVGAGIAAVPDVLEGDTGRHGRGRGQVARLLGAKVEDILRLLVTRNDFGAQLENRRLQREVDDVEPGRIDLRDVDAHGPARVFEQRAAPLEFVDLLGGGWGDPLDDPPPRIEDRPNRRLSLLRFAQSTGDLGASVGLRQREDLLPLKEQYPARLLADGGNGKDSRVPAGWHCEPPFGSVGPALRQLIPGDSRSRLTSRR